MGSAKQTRADRWNAVIVTARRERLDCQKRYLALAAQKGLFQAAKTDRRVEVSILPFMLLTLSTATLCSTPMQMPCPVRNAIPRMEKCTSWSR